MSSPIRLIDGVRRYSPARDRWMDRPAEELPGRVMIEFQAGQTGILDLKNPRAVNWARMIEHQEQRNLPAYIEIDPETSVITRVLMPAVYRVEALNPDEWDNLQVRLRPSALVHLLLRSDPNFETMRDSLQAAIDDGSERLITETRDEHEIIDVREPDGPPPEPPESGPSPPPDPPVTEARAIDLFNRMSTESCAPCNPVGDCMTFLYPDNGCWIRAHIMCHLIEAGGPDTTTNPPEDTGKVWIDFNTAYPVPTPNHPDCSVPWAWHVAPTVTVDLPGPGPHETWVIDPSVCSSAVPLAVWRDQQQIGASTQLGPWTDYNSYGDGYGPSVSLAAARSQMNSFRILLADRCIDFGPPPYSCIRRLFFIMDRNTISDDEVEAMLLGGSPARISDAFYVVLDGYSPNQLGFASPTMEDQPFISPSVSVSDMTVTADRIEFEYPNHLNRRQRLTWVYHIDFTGTSDFTAPRRTIALQATMAAEIGSGTLHLIQQQNPYEVDGSVSWLSIDLRVFQIESGQSRFAETMGTNPNTFITDVISNLNDNSAGETFEDISTDQQTSRLELSQTVNGVPVYNFAVARVRYRSVDTDATDVRVFFRLFPWATSSVEYNQATGYRRHQSGNQIVPLLGKKGSDVTAIPCFASPRIDSATSSLNTQTDTPNVQTIAKNPGGAEVFQYFGCWLDINQPEPHFPLQFPATNIDGPYTSNRKPIQEHIRNEHQCLVAEIAFLPAPAQNGTTPSQSDKLAQRNLAIVETANPGLELSRRIPQTFEIQPSLSTIEHDELMIDWRNVPAGSMATVYLPGIDCGEMLALASRKYRHHRLKWIDEHTLKFETGGFSYLPIPFTDGSFPGLLTIDLPEGIKKDEVFTVVVRQVSGDRRQHVVRLKTEEQLVHGRHIVGSFQLTIPVREKADILPAQQRLLSNLRWIERAIPAGDRWLPVFSRYVAQVAGRVDGLGGDSSKVAPSPSGQWRQAYRTCRLFLLISALLLAALVISGGTLAGGLVVLAAILIAALLTGTLYLWRKNCRPTTCQLLLALLAGLASGAIILALLAILGLSTPRLMDILIVSASAAVATAVMSWIRGCFG